MPKIDCPECGELIEIETDEFLSDCSSRETKEIIKSLVEDGYLKEDSIITDNLEGFHELEWNKICDKIHKSRLTISTEDEKLIRQIYERL